MTGKRSVTVMAAVALATAACGGRGDGGAAPRRERPSASPTASAPAATPQARDPEPSRPRRVDPREGGFEVGFGEFAVTLEADAIRPGPVTFEVTNGGKLVHGFEMEIEGVDEDNSGPGSGDDDGFKVERPAVSPGESMRFRLDLAPGLYKVECFVDGHDDLGMEALLEVRTDAPLVRERTAEPDAVMISGFAFEPEVVEVEAGTTVTWMNHDPEDHTVTAEDGSFGSDPFGSGRTFRATFDDPGTYAYICAIHPSMKGTVEVS